LAIATNSVNNWASWALLSCHSGVQGLGLGDRFALAGQVAFGLVAQYRDEQIVHAGEVVVHQCGLDPGLGRHPPRGGRSISLGEHDLGGRLDQRLPRRLPANPWPLVSNGA
jgi:hypothetical protein